MQNNTAVRHSGLDFQKYICAFMVDLHPRAISRSGIS